jgi:ubiquinone/menaquinone biosynthesis C-methylase UbiE
MIQHQKLSLEKWNEAAEEWHGRSKQMWTKGSRKTVLPLFTQYVPKEGKILDAGCGDGYSSFSLAKLGCDVVGLDYSDEMIHKASEKEHEGLTFVQGDLCDLPFENASFRSVLAITSIEWSGDPFKAIKEFHRVLVDDGILCVGILGPTAPPRGHSFDRLYGKEVLCHTVMPWEFQRLCTENGWELLHGEGVFNPKVIDPSIVSTLPLFSQQAVSFMWLFIFKKQVN